MKITLIVPTKDRPKDIQNLFASILKQTRPADCIIVVDGSDRPIQELMESYQAQLPLKYIPCRPPSLPKQRNVGIANIPEDADWVGFLDDDLVLEIDALENLEKFIINQNNSKLKGIGLTILNQASPKMSSFIRFFKLGDARPGIITKAGYPAAIPCVTEDAKTDWLYGGATFWSHDTLKKFKFDEWFFGTGYMEDIDFSYRVSREYDLMVSSQAQCNHYHHQILVSKEASIGEWQITSWWYFINKHKDFDLKYVYWGMFGLVLKNIMAVIYYRSKSHFNRSVGHFRGLSKILCGTALQLKVFYK